MASAIHSFTDRKALRRRIGDTYFQGLAGGDVSGVPYADDIMLRVPLARSGEECPLRGKAAVLAFFAGMYDAFSATHVKEYYFNDTLSAICVQAEIELRATGQMLRVANVFNVDQQGRFTAQHNHFDPRPAIAYTALRTRSSVR